MSPLVLAQHVTKWYGPRRAVTDVSFAIERGEIVGLLGPNGSGKSTIFRMLTGYLVPTSGRIEVAGHDVVTDSLAVRRVISYVPEDAPLYDSLSHGSTASTTYEERIRRLVASDTFVTRRAP